jgi:hypothetical protein
MRNAIWMFDRLQLLVAYIFLISVDGEEGVKVPSAHLKGYVMYLWLCCALRAAAIDWAASCRLSDTTYSAHQECGSAVHRSAASN